MLTQKQIDFYHETGYLGVENVLSAQDIIDLRRVTEEFVEKSRQVTEHTDVFDLEPGHTPEVPRVRRIKNPAAQHIVYDQVRCDDRILDIVEQLIGPGVRSMGNKLNMKYPDFGSPVEWHQDWAFYPHTNDDVLAVGVAIDDMSVENGALMVIPGSHKGQTYDHHQNGRFAGAVTDPNFKPDGAVAIKVKAGGISIHHVRALHGSAPNTSSKPRRLLLAAYAAIDAWPLSGGDWDALSANVLRGELTNQVRMVAAPVRLALPRAERGGSIYETQTVLEKPLYRITDR
ncbi:MAG: phytanoyl-CoA dioxygenase family protein [Candidatus Poribacteria bacterium]|nr:phytanoyl-CoA dioxygenase family protein [Candidatus Poribacteria bacterium]